MSDNTLESNDAKTTTGSEVIVLDDDEMEVEKAEQADNRCINYACKSGADPIDAPSFCLSYYCIKGKARGQKVCQSCFDTAVNHFFDIGNAMREGRSVLSLDYPNFNEVVALDSDDEEPDVEDVDQAAIEMLEEHLADMLEECKMKYNIEDQMKTTLAELRTRVESANAKSDQLVQEVKEVRKEFDAITYNLSRALYFPHEERPELVIDHVGDDDDDDTPDVEAVDVQILRPPADLPLRGATVRPKLVVGEHYYTRRTDLTSWMKVKLEAILPPGSRINGSLIGCCMFQVLRDTSAVQRQERRFVNGKNLAYAHTLPVLLEIGTRVIALFDDKMQQYSRTRVYYPGIVGEFPCAFNRYRYLIFFDDGYALYVHHREVFLIYEAAKEVWEDVYQESRAFIKKYLTEYPNRSMVKFQKDQRVRTEYKGKWFETTVMEVDGSLVQMYFENLKRMEWIYRGSRRLKTMYKEEQAVSNRMNLKHRYPRARNRPSTITGAPYVEYSSIRDDNDVVFVSQQPLEKPGSRAVAKKSTRPPPTAALQQQQEQQQQQQHRPPVQHEKPPPGKIVYYTPRKPYSFYQYKPHACSGKCVKHITPLARLKGYGPLAKPLLSGFYRMLYKAKYRRPFVLYKTPCGRTTRNMDELHAYLRITGSELAVDLFDFDPTVRCLAEFILEPDACINKDLSDGREQVQVPVVNYVNNAVCDFVGYSTMRTPLEGVNLNLDPDFLTCCDCTDDCADKARCACWKLTQEGAKYLRRNPDHVGYVYRRLLEPVSTGIYECNARCRCARTCLNRVAQNPLQHKLQVFLTSNNRGWGIRCLNDIPQGSFICIYAGSLLTDQMANEGGQTCGDEYFAELDFIETVEGVKGDYEDEAYQSDGDVGATPEIRRAAKKCDEKQQPAKAAAPCDAPVATDDAAPPPEEDSIRSRLRKRDVEINYKKFAEEALNFSDEEERDAAARDPISFNPDGDMDAPSTRVPSVRNYFGKDENVYIMDAKSTGNLGRFLNHSCSPNVFVQNVFVDTHDLRFPWVSFFAMQFIRAGTELTWNYNYEVGGVEGKVLYCNCGSADCKVRLL